MSLTDVGEDRIEQISRFGLVFEHAYFVLGSGGYDTLSPATPTSINKTLTGLTAEVYRAPIPAGNTVLETIVSPRGKEAVYCSARGGEINSPVGEAGLVCRVTDPGSTSLSVGDEFLLAVAHFGRKILGTQQTFSMCWKIDYSILPSAALPYDYLHAPGNSGFSPLSSAVQQNYIGSTTTFSTSVNTIAIFPFFVGRGGLTVSRAGVVNFTAGAGRAVRVGIYSVPPPSAHDLYPTTLVQDFGLIDTTVAGARYSATLSSPLVLQNALYWIAVHQATATGSTLTAAASITGGPATGGRVYLGWAAATNLPNRMATATLTTGLSLPSTFPAGAALSTSLSAIPLVLLE